jgi:hypothetical protein
MKTTLDLPDELMRAVKIRAVEQNRKLKDTVADLLRRGLADSSKPEDAPERRRVTLPLIRCSRARPEEELTAERVAELLIAEEAEAYRASLR